jgi:hypothetical protein
MTTSIGFGTGIETYKILIKVQQCSTSALAATANRALRLSLLHKVMDTQPTILDALPPAREIPSAFAASMRSWWSVGEKQSAISEERLLR